MKKYYSLTSNCGARCVRCRITFSTAADFAQHCGKSGCLSPAKIGLSWNADTDEWYRKAA